METDMCGTEPRTQLPLVSSAAGCSCCSTQDPAPTSTAASTDAESGVEFGVEGLTCGHCVQTVEKAVAALDGVAAASVQLIPGGRSRLIVAGKADSATVGAAVAAAGYTLASN
jgi:copper chaperone CopZ